MARILVVEDSAHQRSEICRVLAADGHELLEAVNGYEGLELAALSRLDCVLLDLLMPGMSGLDMLQLMYDLEIDIPVIVFAGRMQPCIRQQCQKLGAAAFVNKPLKARELVNTISQMLTPNGKQDEGVG
jgi:CheY-like chemotaxis protein